MEVWPLTRESDEIRHRLEERITSLFFQGVLSPEEIACLNYRYGLFDGRTYTLEEIASTGEIDLETAENVIAVILRKLRTGK